MGFLQLLSFYTRLPLPRRGFDVEAFRRAQPLLPLVGLVIGAILAVLALASDALTLPPLIRGAVLLAAYAIITGGLHLDGLADSCDGIFAGQGRQRALEIMKDSHIGSFGVLALVVAAASYLALFSYASLPAILGAMIIGRVAPSLSSALAPQARRSGMGVQAGRASPKTAAAVAIAAIVGTVALAVLLALLTAALASAQPAANAQPVALAPAALAQPAALDGVQLDSSVLAVPQSLIAGSLATLVAALIALLGSVLLTRYLKRQLGGITGDTLGASIELAQLSFLLVVQIVASLSF